MWEIKTKTPLRVIPLKDGRKVTGYKLVGNGVGESTTATQQSISA